MPLREFEMSGCRARDSRGCLLGDSTLRVFVPGEDLHVFDVRANTTVELPITRRSLQGGTRGTLQVPADATALRVVRGREVAVVPLLRDAPPAWLVRAREARARGALDAAERECTTVLDAGTPAERGAAAGLLARIALTRGHIDTAVQFFESALQQHRRSDDVAALADDSFALSFALSQRTHRYREARAVLEALRPDQLSDDSRARAEYYSGILAQETGDLRSALSRLRATVAAAERLGLSRLGRNARQALALLKLRVGDPEAAAAALAAVASELEDEDDVGPCERSELAINRSYAELESEATPRDATRAELEVVLKSSSCPDPSLRSVAAGNLALFAFRKGQDERAREWLTRASAEAEIDSAERFFQQDLSARIALREGHLTQALATFEDMLERARATALLEVEWRAWTGKAEALARMGKTAAALTAYGASETLLDQSSTMVPLGEGRSAFLGAHARSARDYAALLLGSDHVARAAAVARQASRRTTASAELLQTIATLPADARERWEHAVGAYRAARQTYEDEAAHDWQAPLGTLQARLQLRAEQQRELRRSLEQALAQVSTGIPSSVRDAPPAPGQLRMTWVGGSVVLERDAVARVYPLGSAESPFAAVEPASMQGLQRIELFPAEPFASMWLQGAPVGERRLIDWAPVVYPLVGAPPGPAIDLRRVLIVGDPSRDLPGAEREARSASEVFQARGLAVNLLLGEDATHEAVVQALRDSDLFYYAGHGEYAGLDGVESRLRLARDGALTVSDVLALPQAPAEAVFSSCDSGRSSDHQSSVSTLGLAAAWLARGGRTVVAAPSAVSDRDSELLMGALVGELTRAPQPDLARALTDAQRRVVAAAPGVLAYRALTR